MLSWRKEGTPVLEDIAADEHRQSPAPSAAGARPKLVVLISCLNEERTVASVVQSVPRRLAGIGVVEVVVLDDGSADSTAKRAREAGAEVVRHAVNQGLGRTFRHGVLAALERGADFAVHLDGDGQFDGGDIPVLLAPILVGEAEMVTASRFLDPQLTPRMPTLKRWGNRWVAWAVRVLTGKRFADVSCGFRAFSREGLLRMNLFGTFTYTQETFLDLTFKGLPIVEVPVRVEGERRYGSSRVAANLSRYAVRSLQIMLRAFIAYRPFPVFSTVAAAFLLAGGGLLVFLLVHYLRTGAFSPHIWAGFVGGSLCFVGVTTLVTALLAEMLARVVRNEEEILYLLKKGQPAAAELIRARTR